MVATTRTRSPAGCGSRTQYLRRTRMFTALVLCGRARVRTCWRGGGCKRWRCYRRRAHPERGQLLNSRLRVCHPTTKYWILYGLVTCRTQPHTERPTLSHRALDWPIDAPDTREQCKIFCWSSARKQCDESLAYVRLRPCASERESSLPVLHFDQQDGHTPSTRTHRSGQERTFGDSHGLDK